LYRDSLESSLEELEVRSELELELELEFESELLDKDLDLDKLSFRVVVRLDCRGSETGLFTSFLDFSGGSEFFSTLGINPDPNVTAGFGRISVWAWVSGRDWGYTSKSERARTVEGWSTLSEPELESEPESLELEPDPELDPEESVDDVELELSVEPESSEELESGTFSFDPYFLLSFLSSIFNCFFISSSGGFWFFRIGLSVLSFKQADLEGRDE